MSLTVEEILQTCRSWAVVGVSAKPERDSHRVAKFLKDRGYRVYPVNPRLGSWEGDTVYPNLLSIPDPVDVVDLFRRPEDVPSHVEEAIELGARVVWMQLGISHATASKRAEAAGLTVIQNRCPVVETRRLWPGDDGPRF
jgi:predicted CoA-binding protein